MTFEELGIAPEIIKAIQEIGFEQPMSVQEMVIPLLLAKKTDIVALAQTGTGKTAAYGLPLVQQVDVNQAFTQTLILSPTRELCLQIADDLTEFAKYVKGLKVLPVYGGANIESQITALKKGVHIIVATPGRLIDLIQRKAARLNKVTKVVLDEADEMLNMGFLDSINEILAHLPDERNTLLFSATMPAEIATIAKKYMNNPEEVTIGRKNTGAENIKHVCYTVHAKDKYLTLKRIADYYPNIYGIVFCRTRRETQEVADKLIQDGYNAEALHGDLSQAQRDTVMSKFRIRNIQLLVATDVAARGIDVEDLTHVINYNLPDDMEAYTHRSGRTGRAGKTGISIAIINLKEKHIIRLIEKKINKKFVWSKVPDGKEICEKQLFNLIDRLEKVEIDNTEIEPYLPMIFNKLDWFDKEELIKRLVSLEFNRFLDYYRNAPDLNQVEQFERRDHRDIKESRESRKSSRSEGPRRKLEGYTRLFINLGKIDGVYPNQIIELVNKNTRGMKVPIGKIDLLKKFSFFEVESSYAETVVKMLKGITFENRKVNVEITKNQEVEKTEYNRKSRR